MTNIEIKEREADLLVLLHIVAKKRVFILCLFLVFAVFSFVGAFLIPDLHKSYEVSEIIKQPIVGLNKYVVPLSEINEKIKKGVYNNKVVKIIGLTDLENFDFIVTVSKSGDFFKVALNVKEGDIKEGVSILNTLFIVLKNEYQGIIDRKIIDLDSSILFAKLNVEKKNIVVESIFQNLEIKREIIKKKENLLKEYNHLSFMFDERIKNGLEELVEISNRQKKISRAVRLKNIAIDSLVKKRSKISSKLKIINEEISKLIKELKDLEKEKEEELKHRNTALRVFSNLTTDREVVSNFVQLRISTKNYKVRLFAAHCMIGLAISLFLALILEFCEKLKKIKS